MLLLGAGSTGSNLAFLVHTFIIRRNYWRPSELNSHCSLGCDVCGILLQGPLSCLPGHPAIWNFDELCALHRFRSQKDKARRQEWNCVLAACIATFQHLFQALCKDVWNGRLNHGQGSGNDTFSLQALAFHFQISLWSCPNNEKKCSNRTHRKHVWPSNSTWWSDACYDSLWSQICLTPSCAFPEVSGGFHLVMQCRTQTSMSRLEVLWVHSMVSFLPALFWAEQNKLKIQRVEESEESQREALEIEISSLACFRGWCRHGSCTSTAEVWSAGVGNFQCFQF